LNNFTFQKLPRNQSTSKQPNHRFSRPLTVHNISKHEAESKANNAGKNLSFRKDSETTDTTDDDEDSYEHHQQQEQNDDTTNLEAQQQQNDQKTKSKSTNRKSSESASDLDEINMVDDQDWDTDIEEERK